MMKPISVWKQELSGGAHAARLAALYCCAPEQTPAQAARYEAVLEGLEATFGPHAEAGLYSAPGRTEIGFIMACSSSEQMVQIAAAAHRAGRGEIFLSL